MAVHDLLFSEGDRHGGNVHIDEHSKLRFIDNDNALGFMFGMRSWFQTRGLDSIFIPIWVRVRVRVAPIFCLRWPHSRCACRVTR
jgi:hypothetical protein